MKKIIILAIVLLTAISVGIILMMVKSNTDPTENQITIGIIMNGSKEDRSWNQSLYEGMEKTADTVNLNVIYKERIPETEECINTIEELIESGSNIIVCNSIGYGDYVIKEAEKHSDVYFYHATGLNSGNNVATYFGRVYQMRYLSGIIAGLQTETNEIGYVATFPISEVNRGLNAFALGVRSVNKDAKIYAKFSNSWVDDNLTEKTTNLLLDDHNIDVVGMHTNSLKVLEVAEERGIWSIGYNYDNSELFTNTYLTAPIWRWEKFFTPRILEYQQNMFEGKYYWEGVETGIVDLAPFTANVKAGISDVVQSELKRMQSETFDVFYGPVKDNNGNIRIAEGESMSDDSMLNKFDWYVEGVEICDKE